MNIMLMKLLFYFTRLVNATKLVTHECHDLCKHYKGGNQFI